jgi:transcriptional regulator with XRE-family HTH domain
VTVVRWTGREARLLRLAMRLGQREFAAKLGLSDTAVASYERPRRRDNVRLRYETQQLLDTALAQAGQDVRDRFQAALVAEREPSAVLNEDVDRPSKELVREIASPVQDLATLSIDGPAPTSIGWVDVEHVRYIVRALAFAENMYGGGFSGEAAAAQLRHSARLVEARASEDVRRAMFEAVGNLGEVVGFSAFDVADYRSARRCFDFALWCAEQAVSWSLRASVLGDMARLATYLGDIDDALSMVELAQVRSDHVSATGRAMMCAMRARLLALMGRHAEATAEVTHADECFARRDTAADPPWFCYYNEAEHQGSTGRALLPIAVSRNQDIAAARLEAAVRLHDDCHPRSRAFSRTRLASLLMRTGDPREATTVGNAVLAEASSLRSSRLRAEIEHLGVLAADHEDIPEVADLRREILRLSADVRAA